MTDDQAAVVREQLRRGRSASTIAYIVGVPLAEVEKEIYRYIDSGKWRRGPQA